MPLDKDVLGSALYANEQQFNNKSLADIGNIEAARLLFWTIQADEIIKHFTANADVLVDITTTGSSTTQHGTTTAKIK